MKYLVFYFFYFNSNSLGISIIHKVAQRLQNAEKVYYICFFNAL